MNGAFPVRGLRGLALAMVTACLGLGSGSALAAWTASGQFLYADRVFDETGFTGAEPPLPVRLADVEVVDANLSGKNAVLATGATDLQGNYEVFVADNKLRDVYVRVITTSDETSDLNIDVHTSSSGKPVYYAGATPTAQNHVPSTDVQFGAAVLGIGQGGEAFNIYDQMLQGTNYLALLNGARPEATKHLSTIWAPTNGVTGSVYDAGARAIILRDSAGYDDTVVLHEMGHYAVHEYSLSHSPGGSHTFSQCNLDIRLAFDEGFATFWGNSVRRAAGMPLSNIYLRSNGAPGPGNIVRLADLETDNLYFCRGAAGEVNVFTFLWDMVDGPTTPDSTPGIDDAMDSLSVPDADIWAIMTGPLLTTTNNSLEDFWDSWFLNPPEAGTLSPMIDLSAELGIDFVEDEWEVNDVYTQAAPIVVNAPPIHASFFRDPDMDGAGALDVDSFSFQASAGSDYTIETLALIGGADTDLRLWDSDGATLLAVHHDRSSSDKSSRIDWTAPRTDQFYAEVSRGIASVGEYGSYDLRILNNSFVDVDEDGYDTISDCNDNDPDVNPGAMEICDGIDQDCDGVIDNGFDMDLDGYTTCQGDCDDDNPSVNPGASEVPGNGVDDDCDGSIDGGIPVDVVSILKAVWSSAQGWLIVEATSTGQPDAVLTLDGFGIMDFDAVKERYVYAAPESGKPSYVTVTSSHLGSATAVVRNPSGGSGGGEGGEDGRSACNESAETGATTKCGDLEPKQ